MSTDDVKERFGAVKEKAKEKVAETVEKARGVMDERFEGARERLHDASERTREKVRERYEEATDRLHEGYERMRGDVDTVVDEAVDFVRENPARAMLLAAATGFVIGLLFRSRH